MRYAILLLFLIPMFAVCVSRPATNDANNVGVLIREYDVPTPNSRPHDQAVAPDGALWYTGQLANKLGRLDPKSGEIKEYPLKTSDSGPHGLAAEEKAIFGSPRISRLTLASSIRAAVRSLNIRCPIHGQKIRIALHSIKRE
jgi:hypothetical protein